MCIRDRYVFWKQPVIGIGGGAVAGTFAYGHVTGQIGKKPEKGK